MTEQASAKKILIVDDEQEICDFLHEYFKERGYQACTATTSDSALVAVNQREPDIVLLDVRLTASPGRYDGIEILGKIRQDHPHIKVIMVTAVEDKNVIDKAMQLGASGYITKPLSLEYLENTVIEKIQEALSPGSKSSPSSSTP